MDREKRKNSKHLMVIVRCQIRKILIKKFKNKFVLYKHQKSKPDP